MSARSASSSSSRSWATIGMGAQRWIDLGPFQLQPSELMKVALVMALAAYYDRLDPAKVSRPFWLVLPLVLTARARWRWS